MTKQRFRVAYSRNDWFHVVDDRDGSVLDTGMGTHAEAQQYADQYNVQEREGAEIRDEVIGS